MRRGTKLVESTVLQRVPAAGCARAARAGWDGERTELDLRLDYSRLAPSPRPAARAEHRLIRDDDDLPMLDETEFVAELRLDDLDPTRSMRIRKTNPSSRTAYEIVKDPRERPPARPRRALFLSPRETRAMWGAVLVAGVALILGAWAFRMELQRLVGLI